MDVLRRLDSPTARRAVPVLAAVLLPLVVALVVVPWRADVPGSAAALVMVATVVAVAARGHRAAGYLAALAAAVWFDLFLAPPYLVLTITHRDDLETTVLLLVVGVAVTELAVRGRHHRATAALDESYLAAIGRVADLAGGASGAGTTTAAVCNDVREVLGARAVRFERGRAGGLPRLTADGRLRVADGWWPVDRGLPGLEFEIVAERGGTGYGRFVVDPGPDARPDPTARRVAKVLADLAGTALAADRRRTSAR